MVRRSSIRGHCISHAGILATYHSETLQKPYWATIVDVQYTEGCKSQPCFRSPGRGTRSGFEAEQRVILERESRMEARDTGGLVSTAGSLSLVWLEQCSDGWR